MKEYACIQVNHHKYVPSTIADMQNQGWRLNTYQATGYGTDVKHYLLFEKGTRSGKQTTYALSTLKGNAVKNQHRNDRQRISRLFRQSK